MQIIYLVTVFQVLNHNETWGTHFLLIFLFLCAALSLFFLSRCLPQKVTGQQQEINNSGQRRTAVDEESALMKKELTALREQLVNTSQELKVGGTNFPWRSGPQSQEVSVLCGTEHDKSPVAIATGI